MGSKVTHLAQNLFANQVNPIYLSYGSQLVAQVQIPITGRSQAGLSAFRPWLSISSCGLFPNTSNCYWCGQDSGDMEYQSVQLKVTKQFSHGLTVTGGLTISKNMTDAFESGVTETGPNNALYNNHYNHTIDTNNIPERLVAAWMYELPVGPGKAHLGSGVPSKILGSWQWNGIATFQKGVPLRIVGPDNTESTRFFAQRRPRQPPVRSDAIESDHQSVFQHRLFCSSASLYTANGPVADPTEA